MLTFDEARDFLDDAIDALPSEIFGDLNGGILLLPDTIPSNDGTNRWCLGQYSVQPRGLGRYITIHYGSMVECYGHLSATEFQERLRDTLHHELIHHLESLAGDRSLEIQDGIDREECLRSIYPASNRWMIGSMGATKVSR